LLVKSKLPKRLAIKMKYGSRITSPLLVLAAILPPLSLSIETVTIEFKSQHKCVGDCLGMGNFFYGTSDIAHALNCNPPWDNNCYCATATESVSKASSWIKKCASDVCAAGDIPQDLKSMYIIYASYCIQAGFTQPGATEWFNPTQSASSTAIPTYPPATTTELTLVTRTASAITSDGTSPTRSQGKCLLLFAVAVMVPWVLQVQSLSKLAPVDVR
jgi:hypothetical protein